MSSPVARPLKRGRQGGPGLRPHRPRGLVWSVGKIEPRPVQERPRLWVFGLGWLALSLVSFGCLWAIAPPRVLPRTASATEFSAERALDWLRRFATQPRPPGSEAHRQARAFLVSELRDLGLSPELQDASATTVVGDHYMGARVTNVLARIPGQHPDAKLVLLVAHYDSVPNGPGAADDGSAVVTLLETARALLAGPRLRRDVWLLFTDAEELGLLGARAFVSQHPLAHRVGVVLNFEARGSRGPVTMYDLTPDNAALVEGLAHAPHPITSSFIAALCRLLPNDSDLTAFREARIPGMSFALADGLEHYHHPTDSVDNLDPRSVQHLGDYALPLARHFAGAAGTGVGSNDRVFFDLLGSRLVSCSTAVARWLGSFVVGAVLLFLFQHRNELASGCPTRRALIGPCFVLSAALCGALWSFASLGIAGSLGSAAAAKPLVLAGMAWSLGLLALLVKRAGSASVKMAWHEANLVWGVVLLAASLVLVPAITIALAVPLAMALAAAWIERRFGESRPQLAWLLVVASCALAMPVAVECVYALVVGGGPQLLLLAGALFGGYLGLFMPLFCGIRRSAALGLFLVGVVLGLVGIARARTQAKSLATDTVIYASNADDGRAIYARPDGEASPWLARLIPPDASRAPLPKLSVIGRIWQFVPAPAPTQSGTNPLRLVSNRLDGQARRLTLELTSDAPCVELWQEQGPGLALLEIDGNRPRRWVRFSPDLDPELFRLATGDQSRRVFWTRYCGPRPRGMQLVLGVKGTAPVALRASEEYLGLGALRRPPGTYPSTESDRLIVTRGYRF